VVGAVIEQVYSGAVTCSGDNTRHQYPEMLYFYLRCTTMRLVTGLHPDPLDDLQRSPSPIVGLKGRGVKKEEEKEEEGKGKGPPMSEVH